MPGLCFPSLSSKNNNITQNTAADRCRASNDACDGHSRLPTAEHLLRPAAQGLQRGAVDGDD